jgi:DNA-directed RNA polymerase subunit alpha
MLTDEPQTVTLNVKGAKTITAKDIKVPGQVEILNKDQHIVDVVGKNTELNVEMRIEKGLGYVAKEFIHKDKVDIGVIAVDAIFTPIRRVSYEVDNMRVGERTDYNRLRIMIETDGTLTAREALERSIEIMIEQLHSIIGFKELNMEVAESSEEESKGDKKTKEPADSEAMKTRIDTLNFSTRTLNALSTANIRTIGGLARKKKEDLLGVDGLGEKGIQEIKRVLSNYGITLK